MGASWVRAVARMTCSLSLGLLLGSAPFSSCRSWEAVYGCLADPSPLALGWSLATGGKGVFFQLRETLLRFQVKNLPASAGDARGAGARPWVRKIP